MPRLIWSPRAAADIQRLYRFLLFKNADAARRAVMTIRRGVQILERQSSIGRPVENMPDIYRELIINFGDSGYIVRYRIETDAVIILAIRHQKEAGY